MGSETFTLLPLLQDSNANRQIKTKKAGPFLTLLW